VDGRELSLGVAETREKGIDRLEPGADAEATALEQALQHRAILFARHGFPARADAPFKAHRVATVPTALVHRPFAVGPEDVLEGVHDLPERGVRLQGLEDRGHRVLFFRRGDLAETVERRLVARAVAPGPQGS
jgi:hypothetical protein